MRFLLFLLFACSPKLHTSSYEGNLTVLYDDGFCELKRVRFEISDKWAYVYLDKTYKCKYIPATNGFSLNCDNIFITTFPLCGRE